MDFDTILRAVASGDPSEVDRLTDGDLEGITDAQRRQLTFTAARHGWYLMLRYLFERRHLFAAAEDEEGRSPLHEAAASGCGLCTLFCMDVLGFDPLSGDRHGVTPYDEALHAPRRDAFDVIRERVGFDLAEGYRNPVMRGFHPDPSVVRVGDDFYLVNSSFVHFPGLPISHSRDLVHWEVIGHAVENLVWSGLAGLGGGFGYWAPDISYYKGRFWVAATLRRDSKPYHVQMLTSAADPRGPWSKPVFLPLSGIDPSIFTDDDGRRYILLNPGATLAEIGENGELLSQQEMIFFGDAKIKPEGPHLLKKDGWYYLFLAEGGTGEDHMETVMRSRSLRGPYQACPYNPILSRKRLNSPVLRSGHGKPVMLPDGRWYMIYLCGRHVEGKTVMGRETALDPITWTPDGWPLVNMLKGPSCLQARPFPQVRSDIRRNDEWVSPRADWTEFASIGGGAIRLRGGPDPATVAPCSLLLRRQTEALFSQSALVDTGGLAEDGLAGLTGYYDERSFFLFGLRRGAEGVSVELIEQLGAQRRTETLARLEGHAARLQAEGEGLTRRLRWTAEDGTAGEHTFRAEYLSDEGLPLPKRFTGALVGLFAVGQGEAEIREYQDEMREG